MRPLVVVRRDAAFDSHFVTRDALFWPIRRAAGELSSHHDFPPVETLDRVFEGKPPVRFVAAAPRRRRRGLVDPRALYDARITLERVVPTRPRCWHDFMNAMVWGTFPKAKGALHARQHRAIAERITPGARTLPARTSELDALALLDEGGVVLLAHDPHAVQTEVKAERGGALRSHVESGAIDVLVFGHAIYESLALGIAPAIVAAVVLGRDREAWDVVQAADEALERVLRDDARLRTPRELTRVNLSEAVSISSTMLACGSRSSLPSCPCSPSASASSRKGKDGSTSRSGTAFAR
jgi:hypothetical protein